ncbi:MAG: polyribonucleotide nucleotidyltransferase, partial [Chloroflexi bacterium]|nr:polyribonucleotide nucleotidyltransferase [Chloroflexota bacterium]
MTTTTATPRLETEERTFSTEIEGQTLEIGTGLLALNASAACTIRYGDTVILATLTDGEPRAGIDFFPLTVDFEERMYAIGKIPGSFFRREGRPGNEATLAARMTDRPIRPLFPKGYRREIQIVLMTLSSDRENPGDIFGVLGASIVLGMSNVPFEGPVSSVRIGRVDGAFKALPTYAEIDESDLDLIVAGTEHSVVMIEAGANQVPEAEVIAGIEYGREIIAKLNALQREIYAALGVDKTPFVKPMPDAALQSRVREDLAGRDQELLESVQGEGFRGVDKLGLEVWERLGGQTDDSLDKRAIRALVEDDVKTLVRTRVVQDNLRPDGRGDQDIRPLSSMVGVLPRTHGTGLFRRGGTQVLSVATLGPLADRQRLDGLAPTLYKRYMHHYNFPPFSVGEARPMRGPGRREIGHGLLAERALLPVLPAAEDFPYAMRVVSDALMSNGSTSMASVCGSSLALMDAGVPISAPVAGIAMGLITGEDESQYRVLTDIAGVEDGLGDMDFKVAGTEFGVTAVQLDIKLQSLPEGLLETVFERARDARMRILEVMHDAIAEPRRELNEFAPRVESIMVEKSKIGAVIGPGGRVIHAMQDETGASINVEDDGTVLVSGTDAAGVRRAIEMIRGLTKEIEIGEIYEGTVSRIMAFGAFVEILPGKDGLVHISDLADHHVNRVEDEVHEGDKLRVRVIEIDNLGRVNLTRLRDDDDGSERVGLSADATSNAEDRPSAGGGDRGTSGDRGPRDGGGDRGPRDSG